MMDEMEHEKIWKTTEEAGEMKSMLAKTGGTLKQMVGKQIAGWKILFMEQRGRDFKVIFQHITSNEVKIVHEHAFVWKEQGIPVLLAKAETHPAAELGHFCAKHGEFFHGDFCEFCVGFHATLPKARCRICGVKPVVQGNTCVDCFKVFIGMEEPPPDLKVEVKGKYTYYTRGGYTYIEPLETGPTASVITPSN